MGVGAQQYPLNHPWEIPKVEDVMWLGGGWQEVLHCSSINCLSSLDQHLPIPWEEDQSHSRAEMRTPRPQVNNQEATGASYRKNRTSNPFPKCQSVIELKILVKMSSSKALMETMLRWRVNRPGNTDMSLHAYFPDLITLGKSRVSFPLLSWSITLPSNMSA